MRDYGKISPQFWIGKTGKAIKAGGPESVVVAMYLMSSPHSNMIGMYYLPMIYLAHETGLGMEGASKGLRRALEAGFCSYDEASEVVWVHEMARYQIADELKANDLRTKGVQREIDSVPENPFISAFYEKYSAAFKLVNPAKKQSPFEAPSKPLVSQEQEQEQEQERERRASTPQKTTRSNQTQVPDDFVPDQSSTASVASAKTAGVDVEHERQMFVLHYQANGEYRSNWQAQFRKWLLQAQQRKADEAKRSNVAQMQGNRRSYEDFRREKVALFGRIDGEAAAKAAFEWQEKQYARAG